MDRLHLGSAVLVGSLCEQGAFARPRQVVGCEVKENGVIVETTDPGIAVATEQASDLACDVIVVDVESRGARSVSWVVRTAYGTSAMLLFEQLMVRFERDAVIMAQVLAGLVVRVFGVAVRTILPFSFGRVRSSSSLHASLAPLSEVGFAFDVIGAELIKRLFGATTGTSLHPRRIA
jgi:hypothetical protein